MCCYINWCNLLGHSHEQYESLPEDEKEKVESILLIMDKFSMSQEGYRELSQVEQSLPQAHVVQNYAKLLDSQ